MKIKNDKEYTQNEIAHIYDQLFEDHSRLRDSEAYYSWVLEKLAPAAKSSLLDVACGEGLLVRAAVKQGISGIGIDLSKQAAVLANGHLGKPIISIANGESLPFADQSFDYVTNTGSLEHFMNPLVGIHEMLRVLKKNGQAALVLPNSYYLVDIIWNVWRTGYGPNHKQPLQRFATYREWWDLLEQGGLKVIRTYKYNFCFPRSKADWSWYMSNPKKVLYLCLAPFIPNNLSNHFLYICTPNA